MAVGVIDLVLEDAGREVLHHDVDRLAVVIDAAHAQLLIPRHLAAEERHAQAAFPVGDRLCSDRLVRRIEDGADADLDSAIPSAVWSIYYSAGQSCEARSRVLVEQSLYDEFVGRVDSLLERKEQEIMAV